MKISVFLTAAGSEFLKVGFGRARKRRKRRTKVAFLTTANMFVIKRDGRREEVKFDKITARIKKLCYGKL